jgi:hypothetical protein
MFFLKIKRARGSGIDLTPFFGLEIFLLLFGVVYIVWAYHHYLIYGFELDVLWIYKVSILMTYLGLIGFIFFSEKMFGKTKFIFTIFSIGCCIYGIFFTFTIEDLRLFTYFTNPINVTIIFVSFLYTLVFKTKGKIRQKMALSFIAFLGFTFFFVLDTNFGRTLLPFPIEVTAVIAKIGLIITLNIQGIIFLSFETFTEFGWKERLKELYIIAPSGATLFHHSFISDLETPTHDLISSGLIGIKGILGEIMESRQHLKIVDHEDVKIIFEYGQYTTMALIVYENLSIYHSKLASLRSQFEDLFQDILAHWAGEIEVFLPAKRLIEKTFD